MANENCDSFNTAAAAIAKIKTLDDTKFQQLVSYKEDGKQRFLVIYKT